MEPVRVQSSPHHAAVVAVGSEMLGPVRIDTNSLKITALLEEFGIPLVRKAVVGDLLADLAGEIRHASGRADLLITTGGLGPTEDDLTREALAEAFGLEMKIEPEIVRWLEKRFAERGMVMPDVNRKQANVFVGQTMLPNERGSAPGHHLAIGDKHVWVFPGVPHELEWMLETYLRPWLMEVCGGLSRQRRVLKIAGLGESTVEEMLAPYYAAHTGELLTILATSGQVELHLHEDGDESAARDRLAARERELLEIFGERIFGFDDDTLESVVGRLLKERGETVATAESCTGGLLGSRITDIAGSSAYYLGGAVCYTAAAKSALAGVDPAVIRAHGEVSEEVARALAEGIRERFGATWGIGVTGILGPSGGTPEKPVGTVHLAVAGPGAAKHRRLGWPAPRHIIKWHATQQALDLLRRSLL